MSATTKNLLRKLFIAAMIAVFSIPCRHTVAREKISGVIYTPVMGVPSMVIPGTGLEIKVDFGDSKCYLDSVELRPSFDDEGSGKPVSLEPGKDKAMGKTILKVTIPENMPAGLYYLCIDYRTGDRDRTDCSHHSVAVIEKFKKEFRFAVFSDYHVGDPRGIKSGPGIPLEELRAKAVAALNESAPDFALVTGDLTAYPTGYLTDYDTAYNEFLHSARVPLFIVPGNHDLYTMGPSPRADGVSYWTTTFGPLRQAFNYGKYRFIGIDSYSWPGIYRDRFAGERFEETDSYSAGTLSPEEFEWVKHQVETARSEGLEPLIFAHHSPENFSKYAGDDKYTFITGKDFLEYLVEAGIKYYFFGHTHRNFIRKKDGLSLVCAGTTGSETRDDWTFRIVDVSADGSFDIKTVTFWKPAE